MREEYWEDDYCGIDYGITPAHAGRICPTVRRDKTEEDHPRACGTNPNLFSSLLPTLGSPPRMREELGEAGSSAALLGITPAHAGRIELPRL